MVVRDGAPQCLKQRGMLGLQPSIGERDQSIRVRLTIGNRLEDGAAAEPQQITNEAGDLEVSVFEYLLDPQRVLRDLTHELLARAREIAQLENRRRRDEAGADQ